MRSKKIKGAVHTLFQALIDPGSYSSDKSSIVSYVSENYYNKIKAKYSSFIVGDCSCSPTKTCTAVGCFTSTNCVNLSCILSANNITTEEILIPFRIVKSLPINELIIGLQDVRKHKLTKIFSHLFEEKDDDPSEGQDWNWEDYK